MNVPASDRARSPFHGLTRNVVTLGAASLLTDVSSEMIIPVLPLFVTATLGASVASLGVIEGVAECTASILRIATGWLSDRIGQRKPFIVFGYGLSTVAKGAMTLAASWPAVLGLRFSDRVGKGLRSPPRDALIADSSAPEYRGRAFGFHRGMDTLGAALGPLAAFFMLRARPHDFRRIFALSIVPAALAVLVILIFARAPRRAPAAPKPLHAQFGGFGGAFKRFLAIDAVFQLGNSSMAFVLLRSAAVGFSAAQVTLVYFGYNILYALLSMPAGDLSDRIGRRPLLVLGYVLYAIAYGVYYTVVGAALLPASIIAGLLWQRVGPAATFAFAAALALLAAIGFAVFLPSHREHQDRHVE